MGAYLSGRGAAYANSSAGASAKMAVAFAAGNGCWPVGAMRPLDYYSSTTGIFGASFGGGPQAWAILGTRALSQAAPASAIDVLKNAQQADGGWEWSPGWGSDTNSTALAMQALIAAGEPVTASAVISGLNFLDAAQNGDGGFPYAPPDAASDSNSTAYVVFTPAIPLLAGCLILLIVVGAAGLAWADGPHRAGLVIAHDGEVLKRCVEFSEDEIGGLDLLQRADLDLNYAQTGQGATICRIDRQGCSYSEQDCFCQCQGSPCIYWSAWSLAGDGWKYSNVGASGMRVRDGKVIGWNWAAGSTGQAEPAPSASFEEICGAAPTDTPTLSPTVTPSAQPPIGTETPTPTETRRPRAQPPPGTATLRPPAIAYFTADRSAISAGESVLLSWDLDGAKAAYLRYDGTEEGVVAPGSKSVVPETTTEYTLVARGDGGEVKARLTITVNLPAFTATPMPTAVPPPSATLTPPPAAPTATPGPSPTAPATAPGPPTDTPAPPAATPQLSPGETGPAVASTRASSTLTPTPVALAAAPGAQKQTTPSTLRGDRAAKLVYWLRFYGVFFLGAPRSERALRRP